MSFFFFINVCLYHLFNVFVCMFVCFCVFDVFVNVCPYTYVFICVFDVTEKARKGKNLFNSS